MQNELSYTNSLIPLHQIKQFIKEHIFQLNPKGICTEQQENWGKTINYGKDHTYQLAHLLKLMPLVQKSSELRCTQLKKTQQLQTRKSK